MCVNIERKKYLGDNKFIVCVCECFLRSIKKDLYHADRQHKQIGISDKIRVRDAVIFCDLVNLSCYGCRAARRFNQTRSV